MSMLSLRKKEQFLYHPAVETAVMAAEGIAPIYLWQIVIIPFGLSESSIKGLPDELYDIQRT
jgi:hypothetical protein